MKVYVLIEIDWETQDILGVYANEEDAIKEKIRLEEIQNSIKPKPVYSHDLLYYRVEEWEVIK